MDKYLEAIKTFDTVANTIQEAASNLQHQFEELIADDKEMHDKACRGKSKKYFTFVMICSFIFHNLKDSCHNSYLNEVVITI